MSSPFEIPAAPYAFPLDPKRCALLIIDMQRDFLEPGGFGASLGNDVTLLRHAIAPIHRVLETWRQLKLPVFHTREGHRPDLSDLPASKLTRGKPSLRIGDHGPNGRILIQGEAGHDIIPELAPLPGEAVIDKPGKGAFWSTSLQAQLQDKGIQQLVICGVTTEVCVHTTTREANDRGYDCLVLSDATASYFPRFHEVALEMISAQGGIFGWVASSRELLTRINTPAPIA